MVREHAFDGRGEGQVQGGEEGHGAGGGGGTPCPPPAAAAGATARGAGSACAACCLLLLLLLAWHRPSRSCLLGLLLVWCCWCCPAGWGLLRCCCPLGRPSPYRLRAPLLLLAWLLLLLPRGRG